MTILSRLLIAGTLLSSALVSVTAVNVSPLGGSSSDHHDHVARNHRQRGARLNERSPPIEDLMELKYANGTTDYEDDGGEVEGEPETETEIEIEGEGEEVEVEVEGPGFGPHIETKRGNSKKIGLAWAGNKDSNIQRFVSAETKYIYTWSPWCPAETKKAGLTCCPMLWGTKQISTFQQQKYKGGKCVMGMNEVNVPSQGQISVQDGLNLWNKYIRPMKKQGYYTISPSVTSGDDGIAWLKQFYAKCGGNHCDVDATAMHYYGTTSEDFIKWANKFHALGNGKVWVTEIACQSFGNGKQCTKDQVFTFMDKTTGWMKQTAWIEAYFFFGLFQDMYNVNPLNRLVDGSGGPNTLGHKYVGH